MKSLKKILSVCAVAMLCLAMTVGLTGCGEPEPPEFMNQKINTYELSEIVDSGIYHNSDESKSDYIEILDGNQLALKGFDGEELAKDYAELLSEAGTSKERFIELLETPYRTTVRDGETEGTYKIGVPIFGDNKNVKLILDYNSEDKSIFYHQNLYRKNMEEDKK